MKILLHFKTNLFPRIEDPRTWLTINRTDFSLLRLFLLFLFLLVLFGCSGPCYDFNSWHSRYVMSMKDMCYEK